MKTAFLFLLAFGLAAEAEDLITLDHKTYREFRVLQTNVFALKITSPSGGGWVNFTNLPPDVQSKYGYDPIRAEASARKQEKIKKLGRLGAVYRLSELTEAQAEARRDGKPLAFLATEVICLQSKDGLLEKGSNSATVHAFEALKLVSVIVFSDCKTENHTEPSLVDAALHPPEDVHYTPPKVVITDAELTKVILLCRTIPTPPAGRN